jgi:transposase
LLIHGARSFLLRLKWRTDQGAVWLARLVARRGPNVAAVALANKNARVIWALLAHGRDYQADYIATPATA